MAQDVRLPDVWVTLQDAEMFRAAAARRGVPFAGFTRLALRLLVWADTEFLLRREESGPDQRLCVLCGSPFTGDSEHDAMAHAPCTSQMANLEKELACLTADR